MPKRLSNTALRRQFALIFYPLYRSAQFFTVVNFNYFWNYLFLKKKKKFFCPCWQWNGTPIFIYVSKVYCCTQLCVTVKSRPWTISQKSTGVLMTMALEMKSIMALSSWSRESYENRPLYHVTFVGRGYNRILLAFNSLLCGQAHLNVSTVSCLFRNRLEIGNTNANLLPITCSLSLYLTVCTGLQ